MIGNLAKTGAEQLAASPQLANLLARLGAPRSQLRIFNRWYIDDCRDSCRLRRHGHAAMQSEETEARAEHVLATPVSRLRWAAGDVLIMVVGTIVVLAAFSVPAGLTYGLSVGNVGYELPRVLAAAMVYLPAVSVMAGIAMALYGLMPRLTFLSWGAL